MPFHFSNSLQVGIFTHAPFLTSKPDGQTHLPLLMISFSLHLGGMALQSPLLYACITCRVDKVDREMLRRWRMKGDFREHGVLDGVDENGRRRPSTHLNSKPSLQMMVHPLPLQAPYPLPLRGSGHSFCLDPHDETHEQLPEPEWKASLYRLSLQYE